MKPPFIILFFLIFTGCIAPTINYNTTQNRPYEIDIERALKPNISQTFLKDFTSSLRAMLEESEAARKAHQQRNAVIRESIKNLPPPDKAFPYNGYHVYHWTKTPIGIVIKNLGTPDSMKNINDGITIYRWGSYVFSDKVGFDGVICIDAKHVEATQSRETMTANLAIAGIAAFFLIIVVGIAANS